jgi:hypothetical protein
MSLTIGLTQISLFLLALVVIDHILWMRRIDARVAKLERKETTKSVADPALDDESVVSGVGPDPKNSKQIELIETEWEWVTPPEPRT